MVDNKFTVYNDKGGAAPPDKQGARRPSPINFKYDTGESLANVLAFEDLLQMEMDRFHNKNKSKELPHFIKKLLKKFPSLQKTSPKSSPSKKLPKKEQHKELQKFLAQLEKKTQNFEKKLAKMWQQMQKPWMELKKESQLKQQVYQRRIDQVCEKTIKALKNISSPLVRLMQKTKIFVQRQWEVVQKKISQQVTNAYEIVKAKLEKTLLVFQPIAAYVKAPLLLAAKYSEKIQQWIVEKAEKTQTLVKEKLNKSYEVAEAKISRTFEVVQQAVTEMVVDPVVTASLWIFQALPVQRVKGSLYNFIALPLQMVRWLDQKRKNYYQRVKNNYQKYKTFVLNYVKKVVGKARSLWDYIMEKVRQFISYIILFIRHFPQYLKELVFVLFRGLGQMTVWVANKSKI